MDHRWFHRIAVNLYMFRLKAFSLILHLAAWSLFLMFPLLFMENGRGVIHFTEIYSIYYLQFCVCYILLFYLNSSFLIPKFFLAKKYLYYFLCVFSLFIGVFFLKPFDQLIKSRTSVSHHFEIRNSSPFDSHLQDFNSMPPPDNGDGQRHDRRNDFGPGPADGNFHGPGNFRHGPYQRNQRFRHQFFHHVDLNSLLIFVLIMAFGMALKSVRQWQITEKRALLAEAEKAIAELSFLKAQINPHFLYNTLNNIYTLSVIGSDKTSESIMKLSNIMRYVTDEAEANFVTLISELSCVSNFIDLQKLRLGKMVTLNYVVTGDPTGYQIAPLLLMTFIENVFKYGLSNHDPAVISIYISVGENQIIFRSQNQIFNSKQHAGRVGIGISNTKKRLDYLYADKYTLNIDQTDNLFTVDLVLRS